MLFLLLNTNKNVKDTNLGISLFKSASLKYNLLFLNLAKKSKKMAEQEVIKHTKKIVATLKSDKHSFWDKVREFITEIFIIVFAITLSIWFHSWSEHRSEQKQVKIFLLGLKHDINEDISQTKMVINDYKMYDTLYTYISHFSPVKQPNKDSIAYVVGLLNRNTFLRPNKNRFNGFLSAGKMNNIESDSLVTEILFYYQEALPQVQSSEGGWLKTQELLMDYLLNNTKDLNDCMSYWQPLASSKGKYLAKRLMPWAQIYDRYNNLIEKGQTIVSLIDKEYPKENKQ